ncbi:MAG: TetR/AcrR family transcriptional regulator [Phycisphaeraceae bacterium]|nr:TetR/AcrR family transcriptional regulator [Phycisphaeraceae bacterium]
MPAPPPPRRPGRPRDPSLADRRREQILCRATEVFARQGVAGTDLQDVADAIGVGKGTLYRYFPNKRALFEAAVARVMSRMQAAIDDGMAGIDDPLEKLDSVVRNYLTFFDEHREYVEVLIQERAALGGRTKPAYFRHRLSQVGRWHDMYLEMMAEGRMQRRPPGQVSDFIGNVLYGRMFTNYMAGRTESIDEQADSLLDILFDGLLTDAERSRRAAVPRKR